MDLTAQATLIGRVALGALLGYSSGSSESTGASRAGERTFGPLTLAAAAATGGYDRRFVTTPFPAAPGDERSSTDD